MESLKELLTPKTFNKLSFVAVVFWILLGVTLCGIFADIENSESRFDFRCDAKLDEKDFIRGKCFGEYGKEYNKLSIPVYGFVIINFSVIAIVSVIYSQCIKSTVHELETCNQDVEEQRQQGNPAQRRLFISYCCQLATKFVLAILFIVLQTQVFYPRNFPSNFNCNLMKEGTNTSAYLSANVTQQTQTYKCHNQRATKKNFWTDAVAVVNGIFAFLELIEIVWILSRARNGKKFMEDSQFYSDHMKPNGDPLQEQQPQQYTKAVPLMLSLPQEVLEQPLRIRIEQLPSTLQNKEPGEGPKPKDLNIEEAVSFTLSLPQETFERPSQIPTEQLPAALQNEQPGEGPKPKDLNIEEAVSLTLSLPQETFEQPSQIPTEQLPAALQNEEQGEGPKHKDLNIEEAVPLTLSLPQETFEQPSQIPTEQLPAALQNEKPGKGPKPKDLNIKEAVPLTLSLPQETLEQPSQIPTEQLPAALQSQQPSQELQAELKSLKDGIIAGTKQLRDLKQPFRPNPGEGPKPKDLETDQIYVNLVIHEGRATYDFPEDRREQLKVYPKPNTNLSECKRVEDIIDDHHNNVLVVGRPGIGKTMLSTKLLRASAFDGFKYVNFDVAFLLKFRRFNSVTDLDLRELLARSETVRDIDDEVWDYIIKNPTKVLLIFDGIDEFSSKSDIAKDDSGYNDTVAEKMPLHCLNNKIASGKLLPGATVITTTRPTAVSCVRLLNFNRTVEILGFTSEQVEDYVEKFTESDHDPDAKETIWQHISTNINLFSLCYIPVNCFIICSCLSLLYASGSSLPTQLTKIYSIALKMFFFRHDDEYRQSQDAYDQLIFKRFKELPSSVQEVFNRLAKIAFVGIKEGRLVFTSREVEGLEDCGLLHRLPDLAGPTPLDPSEAQFCFMHLTVQEFLAAKHVTDTMKKEELREFVEDYIHQGSWQVVMQFVAGLLDIDTAGETPNGDIFTDLLPTSTVEMSEERCYAEEESTTLTCWPAQYEKKLALNLCKCLYELDVKLKSALPKTIEEINFNAVDFSNCMLAPVDCTAIIGFLKNANRKLLLKLTANDIGWLGCMEIKKWIVKSDRSEGDCKLRTLNLSGNGTGDKGAAQLRDALKDEHCKLTVLDLGSNEIGDKGAANLSDALKNVHCKLTVLDLYGNEIGDKGAANLSDALQDPNCKLTELTLSENDIGHKGAAQLRDALKDSNCKLTLLELYYNNIGEKGAEHLSDALKNVHCKLTVLDLGSNEIGHIGAAHLSDALKDSNCKLTELNLGANNIGEKGAAHLSDALKDVNCKLTLLELHFNGIRHQGAVVLSDALKDANCKLTELMLHGNNIGHEGAEHLSDALKDANCKLTLLKLDSKNIETNEPSTYY